MKNKVSFYVNIEKEECSMKSCKCFDLRLKYRNETIWKIRHDCEIKKLLSKRIVIKNNDRLKITVEKLNLT